MSFNTTVWPQMMASNCVSCHAGFTDSRKFTDEPSAFAFAVGNGVAVAGPRSISGNPTGSLFLQKPAQLNGFTTHAPAWPTGSAGYNATVSWINGGLNP